MPELSAPTTNTFTLDDLARATKRRLGPTKLVIGEGLEIDLPSIFRLPKSVREKVWKSLRDLDDIGDGDSDEAEVEGYELLVEATSDVLRLVTPKADELLSAVEAATEGDVLVTANVLGEILGKWMENTQAGEA